jgi:D-amino peptidase
MKVYISFDLEGVTGITNKFDLDERSPRFALSQKLGTGDVNAAVEGAIQAGAKEVYIYDGHGTKRNNLLFENIHPKAKLIRTRLETPGYNMPAFNDTFDAVFLIGWHAKPSMPGILSHCYHPEVFLEWRVNGKPVGEPEFSAAYAGMMGVPVVLFTGDDRSCEEVKQWNPGCECIITKYALDREGGICLSKEVSWENIRAGAKKALSSKDNVKPFKFKIPIHIEADTLFDHHANACSLIPGVEKKSDRTIVYESNDYSETINTLLAITLLSYQSQLG